MVSKSEPQFLCVGEVALRIRQPEKTVRRKIRSGELAAVKLGSGPRAPIRVALADLEKFFVPAGKDRP